jgi:MFS family permease
VVTIAAVGDIIAPRDRGRYQGYFGAVFGVATVVGPLLGGFFVDSLSWRWIFYINLPIGLVALGVLATVFQAHADRISRQIDYLGAVLLAGGLSAIVLFTTLGGTTYPWGSIQMIVLLVTGAVLLVGFVVAEARAAEPILPLAIFRNRVVRVTSAIGFIVGVAMFGSVTYLPLYLQNVKGQSPPRPELPAQRGLFSRRPGAPGRLGRRILQMEDITPSVSHFSMRELRRHLKPRLGVGVVGFEPTTSAV